MALPFPNPFAGQTTQPASPELPRVPWRSNPMVTTAAFGLLGGRNLNEGLANVAQSAPAGMLAKSSLQGFMQKRQDEDAAKAAQRAAWNACMKWKSGLALSAEDQAALAGAPEIALKFMPETPQMYRPLTDPAERAKFGIRPDDPAPYQVGPDNKVSGVGGGGTNVNVNTGEKLTEGQSKDVGFYARGRSADAELTPDLEKALTDLPASLWSNAPVIGNYAVSPEFQTAKRAAAEFLAVVLRKDTGAAVTQTEFDLYGPMYLPVPGDSDQVLEAKRGARKKVIDAIKRGLGTARGMADEIDAEMGAVSAPPPASAPGGAPMSAEEYFSR
jgi:hypothetical protein